MRSMRAAAREFLEMRRAAGRGPAEPREIYEGLVAGGLEFETDNEANRITGIRATLRKNSGIFHRLPNGQYGLLAWYPKAKAAKADDDEKAPVSVKRTTHARVAKHKIGRVAVPNRPSIPKASIGAEFDDYIVMVLDDLSIGKTMTAHDLKQKALELRIPGIEEATDLRSVNVRLLNLKKHRRISKAGVGEWCSIKTETTPPASTGGVVHAFKGAA